MQRDPWCECCDECSCTRAAAMRSIAAEVHMRRRTWLAAVVVIAVGAVALAQSGTEAPANAPSIGKLAPAGEPGTRLQINGVVVGPDGVAVPGASVYAYQTDAEGYYG